MNVLDELMWTWVSGPQPDANSFKCRWADCFISSADPAELDAHMDEHAQQVSGHWYQGALIACGVFGCNVKVNDPTELQNHLKLHVHHAVCQKNGLEVMRESLNSIYNCQFSPDPIVDAFEGPITCQWHECGTTIKTITTFLEHLKNHAFFTEPALYSDGAYYFTCQYESCQSHFVDKPNLSRHMITHTTYKTIACPFCGQTFASAQKLIDHTHRRPPEDLPQKFVCYLCNKAFGCQKLLKDHCERHIRRLQCPHCQYVVNRESDLRNHIDSMHSKNKPFGCEKCDRTYVKKSDLTKHLATHTGQSFPCMQCDAQFAWQKQLKHHMLTHEPDYIKSPYLCHLCGSVYQRGSALSKHLRTFHKLTVPAGFTRFQFKKCHDNMFRLETERVLTEELRSTLADDNTSSPIQLSMDNMMLEYL